MATHSSILAWKIHGQKTLVGYSPWDCKELVMTEQLHFHFCHLLAVWPWGFLVNQIVKSSPAKQETQVRSLGQEDPLEEEMATHSSILAWKIPWMEEPGRLHTLGLQRDWHNWATSLSLLFFFHSCVTLDTLVNLSGPPFSSSVIWCHHNIHLLAH